VARIPFDDGWSVRLPLGPFAAILGADAEPSPVTLPHDALRDAERSADVPSKGAGAYYPPGAYTYLKTFDVPAEWTDKLIFLEFQGAYRHATFFVYEEFAGNRADGYARFVIDATPYVKPGQPNQLRVEVRSGQDSRWYSGAGLHRSVVLHVTDPVRLPVDGIKITTLELEPEQAVVEVATEIANAGTHTRTVTLTTTISDPTGAELDHDATPVTVLPGQSCLVRQRFYVATPALWSADRPQLHGARSSIGAAADDLTTSFGIRKITVDPQNGLRINGETVLLRGACIHHDNGPLGAAAVPRAEERRIELLKQAGFNAIRAAHNPASPAMLDACDRIGMLVMDEAFDMWVRGKSPYDYALDFPQWWADDLSSLVAKDYNHPSVIMYSIGNEIAEVGTPHGSVLARRMAEHLRSLDPTRLVTNGVNSALAVMDELSEQAKDGPAGLNEMLAADLGDVMNQMAMGDNVTRRTAESHSVLDVVGLNYAEGRYALDRELFPHRVIVGSETFPSQIGALWPMVEANPHVIGDFTWTGWDYLGEVGIGATAYAEDPEAKASLEREFPWLTAWCGDIDITGHRRPVSYYREIVFGLRAEPYLAVRRPEHHDHTITMQSPWGWSDSVSSWTWPGFEGKPVTVEVYADAERVALLRDGVELASAVVGESRPMHATLETTYVPGELTAVAYAGALEVGRTSLATAGESRLRATADRTALRSDGTDLAYIAIELVDDAGRLVTGADRSVTVAVGGAGVLAGMCSAKPKTAERFDANSWTTFDGRALAVVRPTGPGVITLTVTSRANDAGPIDRSRAHSAELSPHSVDGPDADTGPDLLDGLPAEAPETVQIEIEVSK
jgi:beta-galactosidase